MRRCAVNLPHRFTNFGLKLILGKTKTTGPDKPQKEIVAHVYRTIPLTGEYWLGVGYQIWNEEQFAYRRDYLVMEPSYDCLECAENLWHQRH